MIPNGSPSTTNTFKVRVCKERGKARVNSAAGYPPNRDAQYKTAEPRIIRYTANGANPCFLTHPMNQATVPYATINETTKPIASTAQPCGSMCVTPIAFSPLPRKDFSKSYQVATTIVGIERKNENSRAEARDIPANCPAAIVDIDLEVPGNTAERIWHAPIQTACHTLPDHLGEQESGDRRHHKGHHDEAQRMRKECAVAASAFRKSSQELRDPFTKVNRQAKNRAQLNHDRIHLPVAARQAYVEKGFGNPQMCRRADGQKFRQSFNDS